MNEQPATGKIDWNALLAETIAIQDFYRALSEQIERAKRREALLPVVPPVGELAYVDGFVLWKGRPVWYSDEARGIPAAAGTNGRGFVDESVLARPLPEPESGPADVRPGLRRWLRLRWRALAYGHAG